MAPPPHPRSAGHPESPVPPDRDPFRLELQRLRTSAGLSKKALARRLAFDPSYISHIESGRHRPSEDFALRADVALGAGGRLHRLWAQLERVTRTGRDARLAGSGASAVVVDREEASLAFDGHDYHIHVRRLLQSVGDLPVAQYWIKIAVGAAPALPLSWEMLQLTANSAGTPMGWRVDVDQPTVKQVWLQFKNHECEFPLYPGEQTWIEYSYRVPRGTWSDFFQRAIRLPTHHLSVGVRLPAALHPRVWGTETSLTADNQALSIAPTTVDVAGDHEWRWEIPEPQLNARVRVEWRFGTEPGPVAFGRTTAGRPQARRPRKVDHPAMRRAWRHRSRRPAVP